MTTLLPDVVLQEIQVESEAGAGGSFQESFSPIHLEKAFSNFAHPIQISAHSCSSSITDYPSSPIHSTLSLA